MLTRRLRLLGFTAAVSACGSPAHQSEAKAPPVVTVTAREYAFDAPDSIEAGPTTFRLVSKGREEHFVGLVRIAAPHTVEEFKRTLTSSAPTPWISGVGGVGTLEPGGTGTTTLDLPPGLYAMLCDMEDPHGTPHMLEGMVHALKVLPTHNGATMPAADDTITLADYAFSLSAPLGPGDHVIEVKNLGPQPHMVLIWRLHPGKSAGDILRWMKQSTDSGTPITLDGGTPDLAPGLSAQLVVHLEESHYALICLVDDVHDHQPHFVHGMLSEIAVQQR
jgi:hypothetical protein